MPAWRADAGTMQSLSRAAARVVLLLLIGATGYEPGTLAHAATGADQIRDFYREHNPEALADGRAEAAISKYAGQEAKFLAKAEKEYSELRRLGIAPKFKWLRNTQWEWEAVGTQRASATTAVFGKDGRFLWGDPRCASGKCSWKSTQHKILVMLGTPAGQQPAEGSTVYRLDVDATKEQYEKQQAQIRGAARDNTTDTVLARFIRAKETGKVLALTTSTWDVATQPTHGSHSRAIMIDFFAPWW